VTPRRLAALLLLAGAGAARGGEPENGARRALKVCEDPNNLPFSNSRGEGFENRIAELLARDLGWELEYTWFPQRIGFIRNTLKKKDPESGRFACDLVIGVPAGLDLAATTKPYYRSTYAMVLAHRHGLEGVRTPDDLLKLDPAVLRTLRFAVFGRTPPAEWLLHHGLMQQAVPYQVQTGDPDEDTGDVIEKDLAAGKIDVALLWGPIAGYLARKGAGGRVTVVAFPPEPGIRYDFSISMAVRKGETAFKERIERILDERRAAIQAILAEYRVPQLEPADAGTR
jgi:mxaJ protein